MLDFSLTQEQIQLQDMARKFALNEIRPVAVEVDRDPDHPYPKELMDKMAQNGFFDMFVPPEYGGIGSDIFTMALVSEELAFGDAGVTVAMLESLAIAKPLMDFGTEEQKRKYLPIVINKEEAKLCGLALTEPEHGSDIAVLDTTAKLEGDHYIINGAKRFITNAGVSELYLLCAMTDKSNGPKGQSVFVITADTPGLSIGKVEDKMGHRTCQNAELILEGARIPKENIVGREGDGFKITLNAFDQLRPVYSGAVAVGVARAAFDYALKYSKERIQFGKPIFAQQAISFRLADMAASIEAARMLVWEACWTVDQKKPSTKLASMSKFFSAEMVMKVTTEAVQVLGGYGYMKDYPVEKYMRDAKIFQIFLGTGEIQRMLVSRTL
ncbi:MAG: acyl-CoA dehydrogenase family protein [Desulfatiglans sp.]|jgi:alkylation response protein AidB-like acyl-CoA dehydrogenase|nr:acyl-CoA dehydrogenase family protein [Desulfatiglans sp.]